MNWDDLRHLLALERAGTLAGAARRLGVDETTVARRLRALERALGTALTQRAEQGRIALTEAGKRAAAQAAQVERAALALAETAAEGPAGAVRISAVPYLVNRLLVPALPALRAEAPEITPELVAEPRAVALDRREADLALRLARPVTGGMGAKTRRLGHLSFDVYAPADKPDALGWIAYDTAHAHLPQARWLAAREAPVLRVADLETAHAAVAAGLGRSLLPRRFAEPDPRLVRRPWAGPVPEREVWLIWLESEIDRASVQAVKAWLEALDWRSGFGLGSP